MKLSGVNMSDVKSDNKSTILYLLNEWGSLSRKDISEKTGLTPAAVTKLCRELLDEGKIIELGEEDAQTVRAGRKKIMLRLNFKKFLIVSVNIQQDVCRYGLYDIAANPVEMGEEPFDGSVSAQEYIASICSKINKIIHNVSGEKTVVIGAGVCIAGSVNKNGVSTGAYGLWKEGTDVKGAFEKELAIPVIVENNVKAFAASELIFNRISDADNLFFIKWGPGVGSALVIDGKVFEGNRRGTAEIGHYIINSYGLHCRCGRKGCLETLISVPALKKNIGAVYNLEDGEDIAELLSDGTNAAVSEISNAAVKLLARAAINIATVIDPDRIVLFGPLFNELTVSRFKEYMKAYDAKVDDKFITLSEHNDKEGYIGAVSIAAKRFFFEDKA